MKGYLNSLLKYDSFNSPLSLSIVILVNELLQLNKHSILDILCNKKRKKYLHINQIRLHSQKLFSK